jgi:O-antigen ligase
MVGMTLAISLLVSLFQKKIVPIILVAFLMLAASVFYVRQNNIQREYSRTQVFVQQLKTLCKTGDVSSLIGDREMLWKAGRVTFEHNFVLGTGLGTYLIRMPNYESEIGTISNDNCAQMFLHIGAEMGIVGLVFFVLLLITTFWRAFPSDGPVLLSLVSFVPTFFFGAHLLSFEVNILFWILLGMLSNTNIGPHEYNERN